PGAPRAAPAGAAAATGAGQTPDSLPRVRKAPDLAPPPRPVSGGGGSAAAGAGAGAEAAPGGQQTGGDSRCPGVARLLGSGRLESSSVLCTAGGDEPPQRLACPSSGGALFQAR